MLFCSLADCLQCESKKFAPLMNFYTPVVFSYPKLSCIVFIKLSLTLITMCCKSFCFNCIITICLCLSVCLVVTTASRAKRLNRSRYSVGRVYLGGPKEPCVKWGARIPHGNGTFCARYTWTCLGAWTPTGRALFVLDILGHAWGARIPHGNGTFCARYTWTYLGGRTPTHMALFVLDILGHAWGVRTPTKMVFFCAGCT